MYRWIYSGNRGTQPNHEGPLVDDLPLMDKSIRDANMQGPLLALELFHVEADWQAGQGPSLQLNGIYEQPGWADSRYESQIIAHYEEYEDDLTEIRDVCQNFAQRLAIPFQYTADGEAHWIDKQGESPERSFVMSWQCWWWAADGITHFEKGDHEIYAASINDAFEATVKYVDSLIDPAGILVECEVRDPLTHDWSAPQNPRRCLSYRWEIANDLKAGCRNGGKPSQTLREIRAKEPELSTLHLMQNVAGAFGFKMRDLALVEGWANGKISPEKLDEWLEPLIRSKEWQWDAVFQLHCQLLEGKRIAPALHEYCVRRESFGYLEIHGLVFEAFEYNPYHDENRFTQQEYRNAVDEWLSRDNRADDEQLDEAFGPLKQHLLVRVKKDGLGGSGVF